jgi:hypothetical protein
MKWFLPICFSLIVLGIAAYWHSGHFFGVSYVEPEEPLLDSSIALLDGLYSPLPGNVVRGKVKGKLTLNFASTVSSVDFCDITTGAVVLVSDSRKELRCDEGQMKTVSVDGDNSFTIDLFSGTYFVDISSLHGISDMFPARISVHKGQLFSFSIPH